jgi:hypothetical protein
MDLHRPSEPTVNEIAGNEIGLVEAEIPRRRLRWTVLVFLSMTVLLAGCASDPSAGPVAGPEVEPDASTPLPGPAPGRSSAAQELLDSELALGFYVPTAVQQIFEELGRVYFEGRIELDPAIIGRVEGDIDAPTLGELLDVLCETGRCAWRVSGNPLVLTISPIEE